MILCSQCTALVAYTNIYHFICIFLLNPNIGSKWMQSLLKQPPAPLLAPLVCSIHWHSLPTHVISASASLLFMIYGVLIC